jgi:hypothetical protein
VEELFPDPAKYKKDDATEQRKYDEDCEKITDKAAEAYALVKEYFQEDSSAWNSVILRANETGRLDILWKFFLEKYDNPVMKARAVQLIRSYYEKATSQNILGLFSTFTEHYIKLKAASRLMLQPQSAGRSLSSMLTPKRLPQQTPAEPMTAGGANGITSMPWASTLHSLFRIIHELINKFIYNEIEKTLIRTLPT